MNALNDLQNGNIHKCFIELAMCDGSCIEGPIMEKYINSPIRHIYSVWSNVGKEDFDVPQPEPEQLRTQYIGTPVHKKLRVRPRYARYCPSSAKTQRPMS